MNAMFERAKTVHAIDCTASVICDAASYADSMGDLTELKRGMCIYELQIK
jgi:hypothetical protein